ncbi:MAG: translocation/assembly module TamB domain-containing protein [Hyphomicrobiaceae bacterium]
MSRTATWLVRIALGVAGLVVLVFAVLMTASGQRLALRVASHAASGPDFTLSIGRLEGSLFNRARIDRIAVADRNGTWLEVRNIRVTWSALSLFGGHINIEQLLADAVELIRQPTASDSTAGPSAGPAVPMMRMTLKRMQIDELILDEAFAGVAARFAIKANADLVDHRHGLKARISAKRLDQPGAEFDAHLAYVPDGRKFAVRVSAAEPAGGLVARLLQMPDKPALALTFSGKGPLDAWQADWSLSAAAQPFVAGRIRLDRDGARHRLATDFAGYVQALVSSDWSTLAAGKTTGSMVGHFSGLARFDVSHMLISNDALRLRGAGGFEPATSFAHGTLSLDVGRADTHPVAIKLSGEAPLSVRNLRMKLSLPDDRSARDISLDLAAQGVTHPLGAVSAFDLSAHAKQTMPTGVRALSAEHIRLQLTADGFNSPVKGLADAVGMRPQLDIKGALKAGALTIERFRLGDATSQLVGSAALSADALSASARLTISDVSRFSTLFGRQLAGHLELEGKASASLRKGDYAVSFDGAAADLTLGQGVLAGLVGKSLQLAGDVAGDAAGGMALRNFKATGKNLSLAAKGRYAQNAIELDHTIDVGDLAAVQPGLTGAAKLTVALRGTPAILSSKVRVSTRDATWSGQAIEGLAFDFDGTGPLTAHGGRAELKGRVGQRQLAGSAQVTLGRGGLFSAQDVSVKIGRNTMTGHLRFAAGATPSGKLVVKAGHLADLDAILGQSISGALTGDVEIFGDKASPSLRVNAEAPVIAFAGSTLKRLTAAAVLRDFTGKMNGRASVTLAELASTTSTARKLSLDLRDREGRMAFAAAGRINGAPMRADGSFQQQGNGVDVTVDRAELKHGRLRVKLVERAQFGFADGSLRIRRLRLAAGGGQLALDGDASRDALNLEARIERVPATIANAFVPDLGLGGTVSGRARLSGSPVKPIAKLDATWHQATAAALRDNHLPPVTIELSGDVRDDTAKVRLVVRGSQSLHLSAEGQVRIKPKNEMRFRLTGDLPLALGNAALAARATQLSGRARLSGIVTGTAGAPKIDAKVQIPVATVFDPATGIKLKRVTGSLEVTERGLVIRTLKGESAFGGWLSVAGTLARGGSGQARADLVAQLGQFKFNDRQLMAGEVDGNVTLVGPLDGLAAKGRILLRRLDVMVPAAAPRSVATLNVKHVNAPEHLAKPIRVKQQRPADAGPLRMSLDLRLDAANRIFVKGRGLDAQLGGSLNVRGTSAAPLTDGAFVMQRGRLDILGRRLEFRRGRVLFDGTLEPVLDMEATTVADDVTVIVAISGVASKPVFKFSSDPELPEDEVLARLLFNKALVGLSPLQLVQLASEVDKIGGLSSGPGIFDKLKRSVGVDVLDVSTDKTGAATISAGRYVTDKTFVGVRQGATAGSSRVIIDHDFTKNLKARGEVGADGNSKLGIGLEWDY